jgi:hypothetical protein
MAGRKPTEIDWEKVDGYLKAQCSGASIAGILGIHDNTLYMRCKTDNNVDFVTYAAQKRGEGKELLRRTQFDKALSGNVVMLIWLGKQYLGQADKTETLAKELPVDVEAVSREFQEKARARGYDITLEEARAYIEPRLLKLVP